MAIAFTCPACKTTSTVGDEFAGRTTNCQACGIALRIPGLAVTEGAPPPLPSAPPPPATKACPFCGETVLEVAKKCKHCGETIDVALRAAEEAKRAAVRPAREPMVFMNAGGASSTSSASSSSAAASSLGSVATDKARLVLTLNKAKLVCCMVLGSFLAVLAVAVVGLGSGGWVLLLLSAAAVALGLQETFTCAFCEKRLQVTWPTDRHKCKRCGVLHILIWK
jgi:hypothetical protein